MSVTTRSDSTVLSLVGDIDIQTAPQLAGCLGELESQVGRDIVVDLTNVDFLDSSGLGVLVAAHRTLSDAGLTLSIACPRPHISKIFQITRLTDVIDVYDTVDSAVARRI